MIESFQNHRIYRDARQAIQKHREKMPYVIAGLAILAIFAFSHSREKTVHVYENEVQPDFRDGRILGSANDPFYDGKDKLISRSVHDLQASQKNDQADLRGALKNRQNYS